MERDIIYFLKTIGMSLECTFCMVMIARFFLERSRITIERIIAYGCIIIVTAAFIQYKIKDAELAGIITYGTMALGIVLFIYTGNILYRLWGIWVSAMILYMIIGVIDLIVRIVFMQMLGFSLVEMNTVETYFWIPEMIGAFIGSHIFKRTPFYYKDKACYKQMSVLKKIMVLVIATGIGTVVQASVLALDGNVKSAAKGSIKSFIRIYAGILASLAWICESYKDIHRTYDNREVLLINNFSKKQAKTDHQLEKLNKANQDAKENLHNQVVNLAKVASRAGLKEVSSYAEHLATTVEPMNQEFLLTGHRILDALLKEKYVIATRKKIELANKISIPDYVAINGTDLSIIVGQAIDYAIDRCEEVEGKKSVKVEGVWYKGYIILKVWYSMAQDVIIEDKTKQEIGIIRRYVTRYEGKLGETIEKGRGKLELSFNAKI